MMELLYIIGITLAILFLAVIICFCLFPKIMLDYKPVERVDKKTNYKTRVFYYAVLTVLFVLLWSIIVVLPAVFFADPKDRDTTPGIFWCLVALSAFVGIKKYIKKKWFKDM